MECWISHVRASHWKGECTGIQCLDVSEASDWWSVGSLMYELLIGRVSVPAYSVSCTSFSLEG